MEVQNRNDAEPFTTKDGSTIREIMAYRNSSVKAQSLAEALVAPGVVTQAHYHPLTEEIYYISSGVGIIAVGDETRTVGAGDAIGILPGTPHQIRNDSDVDLVFLCCCTPPYEHSDTVMVDSLL